MIRRIEGETDLACQIRLTRLKQNGNDIDWHEIAELVGDGRSSEAFRKDSYGIRRLDQYLQEVGKEEMSDEEIDKLNEKILELKIEKNKVSDLKTYVNKESRKLSKVENVINLIIDECKSISDFKLIDTDKVNTYPNGSKANLLVSDVHYDGSESPINNFNKLIDITINKCKLHEINQLNVMLAGDLINNELKTTIRLENQENVSKQIIGVSKLISDGLYKLAKHIPMLTVSICTGNHERGIEDYKKSLTTDNYMPIIKELIQLRIDDIHNIVIIPNVVINDEIDDRFCVLNIDNKTHVVMHGDGLKNVEKNAIRTIEGYIGKNIRIDYLYLGHFHSEKSFQNYDANIIINGALCNGSDYGKKLLLRTPPTQKLMILNDGDVECTYNIKL